MKIPYTLMPRPTREPASAVLLPSSHTEDLFALIERLGLESFPAVFATADGFLVKLERPIDAAVGAVRLRNLADNLYLPVDADLVPPLLADEAQGLTRSRGLIFLPGLRVLEFAPDRPLPLAALLDVPKIEVCEWQALPTPPELADELRELTSTEPPPLADVILEMGRDDIGSEAPGPQDSGAGLGTKMAAGAAYAAGTSLAWLGTKLGLGGLASAGANLLQRAFDKIPMLSKRLMGEQEATLRDLLRDFQEGNIEKALRRALPLSGPNSKPVSPAANAKLPQHNLFYSLQNLLGGRQGPGSLWFTPDDIFYKLQAEYRKQAETAAQRGDYRRAAFIYAKLLNDLAGAARILSQGGLHRDAAVIYEKTLHNLRAAAHEWEAAGEIDKAVEILVRVGDDLPAAELLQKVGERERAMLHFRRAAGKLAVQNKHFEAGELFRVKAQRPDLAMEMFEAGWRTRPQVSALPCGLSLATHYTEEPNPPRFVGLLDDADACLATWSAESTTHFYNRLARLANSKTLAAVAETAQDRCLLALASKMTQPGNVLSVARATGLFFPADSPWPAPVVRDAEFALKTRERPKAQPEPQQFVRLGKSTVRAVCHLPAAGDLFVGFENGEVIHLRIASGNVATLTKQAGPILSLLADPEENYIVALTQATPAKYALFIGQRFVHFHFDYLLNISASSSARFCAAVDNVPTPYFGVLSADTCTLLRRDNPSWSRNIPLALPGEPSAGVVSAMPGAPQSPWCVLFNGERGIFLMDERLILDFPVPAPPAAPSRTTLHQPPVQAWLEGDRTVAIHWVTKEAELYQVRLILDPEATQNPYPEKLATTNPVLGVHGCIDRRLGMTERTNLWDCLHEQWFARGQLFNPVAAFRLASGEILLVEANGTLTRVQNTKQENR